MMDTALDHLPLVLAFIALLIAHMCRLDERISAVVNRRSRAARPPRTFAHREMNGELVLVDPDGRVSRRRRR